MASVLRYYCITTPQHFDSISLLTTGPLRTLRTLLSPTPNVNYIDDSTGFSKKINFFFSKFSDCPALTAELRHTTLLEELVFWTVKYEFPERLVCLLLKLLPDTQYKEALTRSFVRHYSRVSMMLMKSHNSDKLSNRIVHVSVQLFSNEELGTYIYWVLFQNDEMKRS